MTTPAQRLPAIKKLRAEERRRNMIADMLTSPGGSEVLSSDVTIQQVAETRRLLAQAGMDPVEWARRWLPGNSEVLP